jgi:F0F1-type ATP synthase membrane subunit b/b'
MTQNSFYNIPWTVIIFIIGQLGVFIWFVIKIHFASKKNEEDLTHYKNKVDGELQAIKLAIAKETEEIKKENEQLRKELKDMRDILIKVENNTHLLMLGRIKTGQKETI